MKTSSVNSPSATPSASPAKGPTTAADGDTTDFLALFTQTIEGTGAATAPANLLAAALPFGENLGQDDKGGDLDESELAMMMAALAGAPIAPATAVNTSIRDLGNADLLQASSRTDALAGAMADMFASQTASADPDALQDSSFSSLLGDGSTAVDPRMAQGAIDALRDARGSQQTDALVQRQMHAPVGTRAWTEELGSQINWMSERGQHAASLRLSPEHLGPLEIRISIQDDQASVWFGAAHADTRAAIEDALPRLREMLASQGLALNDAGVFKEPPRQQPQFRAEHSGIDGEAGAAEDVKSVSIGRLGLVDAYA